MTTVNSSQFHSLTTTDQEEVKPVQLFGATPSENDPPIAPAPSIDLEQPHLNSSSEKLLETTNSVSALPTPIATPKQSIPLIPPPPQPVLSLEVENDQFETSLSTINEDDDTPAPPPLINSNMSVKQIRTRFNAFKIIAILKLNLDLIRIASQVLHDNSQPDRLQFDELTTRMQTNLRYLASMSDIAQRGDNSIPAPPPPILEPPKSYPAESFPLLAEGYRDLKNYFSTAEQHERAQAINFTPLPLPTPVNTFIKSLSSQQSSNFKTASPLKFEDQLVKARSQANSVDLTSEHGEERERERLEELSEIQMEVAATMPSKRERERSQSIQVPEENKKRARSFSGSINNDSPRMSPQHPNGYLQQQQNLMHQRRLSGPSNSITRPGSALSNHSQHSHLQQPNASRSPAQSLLDQFKSLQNLVAGPNFQSYPPNIQVQLHQNLQSLHQQLRAQQSEVSIPNSPVSESSSSHFRDQLALQEARSQSPQIQIARAHSPREHSNQDSTARSLQMFQQRQLQIQQQQQSQQYFAQQQQQQMAYQQLNHNNRPTYGSPAPQSSIQYPSQFRAQPQFPSTLLSQAQVVPPSATVPNPFAGPVSSIPGADWQDFLN